MDNYFIDDLETDEVYTISVFDDSELYSVEVEDIHTAEKATFVGYKDYTTATVQRTLERVIDRKQEKIELDGAMSFAVWVDNQLQD